MELIETTGARVPLSAPRPRSEAYQQRAAKSIPFGMPSWARGHADVSMRRASGAFLEDLDGNSYVDCVLALGPMFHGNSPQAVIDAVTASMGRGLQFSSPNTAEAGLAERVLGLLPWAEKLVLTNTGTEAVQHALRIARGTTGRQVIVKFEGHYHGWVDPVFVNGPGSPAAVREGHAVRVTHSNSALSAPRDVLVAPWGNLEAFELLMAKTGSSVAAVIIEPAVSGLGNYLPGEGLLEGIKAIAHRHGALVILDEVVTGFRFAAGGLTEMLNFTPDLATYAKAIASGFPLAAVAGTDAAMESVLDGRVSIGGTYNGTPSSVAAAHAVLDIIEGDPGLFGRVEELGRRLKRGIADAATNLQAPVTVNHLASLVQVFYGSSSYRNSYAELAGSDFGAMAEISRGMLSHGAYVLPKGLLFLSTAHTEYEVDKVVDAFHASLTEYLRAR